MRQRPHIRTSRKGRKFRAGRRITRASQLLRDQIRKDIIVEGPYKEKVVRIMEKDPLLYQEYKYAERPKIRVVSGLVEKEKSFAATDMPTGIIRIDKRFFEKGLYEPENKIQQWPGYKPEKALHSDMLISPRQNITHEVFHSNNRPILKSSEKVSEDAAFWRSQFDIRKFKPSQTKLDNDIEQAFRSGILKKEVAKK